METKAELYTKANTLIEDLFLFKEEKCQDLSMMDTIIEYSANRNIPLQELGSILSDHPQYVSILKKDLIREGYFRDEEIEYSDGYAEEEW